METVEIAYFEQFKEAWFVWPQSVKLPWENIKAKNLPTNIPQLIDALHGNLTIDVRVFPRPFTHEGICSPPHMGRDIDLMGGT